MGGERCMASGEDGPGSARCTCIVPQPSVAGAQNWHETMPPPNGREDMTGLNVGCSRPDGQSTVPSLDLEHWQRSLPTRGQGIPVPQQQDCRKISKKCESELLIGASAVTYNPHFPFFSSPYILDVNLGAVAEWPQVPALLIIYASHFRRQLLEKAMAQDSVVWVLRQHQGNPDDPDLAVLNMTARVYAELPKKSMVTHHTECWGSAVRAVGP
jgi:hypothetical protein